MIVSGVFILNVTKDIPQETLNRKRWIVTRQDSREFENVQEEYRDSLKKVAIIIFEFTLFVKYI